MKDKCFWVFSVNILSNCFNRKNLSYIIIAQWYLNHWAGEPLFLSSNPSTYKDKRYENNILKVIFLQQQKYILYIYSAF